MDDSGTNIELEWVESTNTAWAQKDTDNIANRDLVQSMYDVLLQNKEVRLIPTTLLSYNDFHALPSFQYEAPTISELSVFLNTLLTSQLQLAKEICSSTQFSMILKQRMLILKRIYYALVIKYHEKDKASAGQAMNAKNALVVNTVAREAMSGSQALLEIGVKTDLSLLFSLLRQTWQVSGILGIPSLCNSVLEATVDLIKKLPARCLSNDAQLSSLGITSLEQECDFLKNAVLHETAADNRGKLLASEILLGLVLQSRSLRYLLEWIDMALEASCNQTIESDLFAKAVHQLKGVEDRTKEAYSCDPFSMYEAALHLLEALSLMAVDYNTEGLITQALLLNNVEAAVELCLKAKKYADALIIATTGGPDLLAKTQHQYLEKSEGHVANLISAMISEDWGAIINNCDITSWKEALAATLTHASEEDLPVLCEQLGSRLESESSLNPKFAQDAQLCYICSGSFDRLVSSWSDGEINSSKALQELVELVSFLQKSIERQGKRVQISGALADLLSRYASLLASQGNLQTALSYLGSSQNEKVASLRDRLLTSLGQKPLNIQEMRQQQSNRRSSTRTSFTGYGSVGTGTFSSTNPFHSQNQFNQPPAPVATQPTPQFGHNFNTGLPNPTVSNQPWAAQPQPAVQPVSSYNQPPKAFSPAPPPTQPSRPDSVGSGRGGSGHLSRKYLRDPSVTNNQYPTMNQYAPLPSQPTPSFDNNMYNSPMNSAPYGQAATQMYQPPLAGSTASLVPNPSLNPTPLMPSSQPPIEAAQPAVNYQAQSHTSWNDPPVLNRPTRQQPKPDLIASEPITHPIYGTASAQSQPAGNGYGYGDAPPPFHPPPSPYAPQQTGSFGAPPAGSYAPPVGSFTPSGGSYAPAPTGGFSPSNFNQNAIGGVAASSQTQQLVKPETPQPVEKPPVPTEHEVMQKVFEELKDRCTCTANNPQTKRKLEDVGRRLETLYDCLRYNKLSPNALAALHQIVQLVQNGDYTNGLHLHTQMVQGQDFASIANFMLGIKVLLQLALQLHVYLN